MNWARNVYKFVQYIGVRVTPSLVPNYCTQAL